MGCDKSKKDATPNTTQPTKPPTPPNAKTVAPVKTPAKSDSTAQGKSYSIAFERPFKVGDRYQFHAKGSQDMKVSANGQVLKKESEQYTYNYEALVTVKAVSDKGAPTHEEHKVKTFEITRSGKSSPAVAAGATIVGTVKDGKEVFTVNGKEPDKKLSQAIGYIISLEEKDDISMNEMLRPSGKKKVGDSWLADPAKILASYKVKFDKAPLKPGPKDVSAKATLSEAKTMQGVPSLKMTVDVSLKNAAPFMGPVVAKTGEITMKSWGWVPQDTAITLPMTLSRTLKLKIEGHVKKGAQSVDVGVDSTHQQTATRSVVK